MLSIDMCVYMSRETGMVYNNYNNDNNNNNNNCVYKDKTIDILQ